MTTMKSRRVLARPVAEPYLEPYKAILRKTLERAWDWVQEFLDKDKESRKTFDASIQAAMVYRRFVVLLEKRLFADKNVRIKKHGRLVTFIIGGKLRLRFKKFSGNLRSSNVQTKRQEAMHFQLEIEGLDNYLTDVKFGYSTDAVGRKIMGIFITCPQSWNKNAWFIQLGDEQSDALPFVQEPPPELPLPAARLKKPPKEKRG